MIESKISLEKRKTPLKSIHLYCVDCSGGSTKELRLCPCFSCPLYAYRFGKSPFRKKAILSDEERKRRGEFLRKMKEGAQR